MNENKHTKSISRKINANNFVRQLISFLIIDLLIFILSACLWCYSVEASNEDDIKLFSDRNFTSIISVKTDTKTASSSKEQVYLDFKAADTDRFTFIFPKKI